MRRLAGTRNVQSLPFPGQPQEASWSVEAIMLVGLCSITHHVVVSVIQGRGVWHSSVHNPSFSLVFGSDEVLDLTIPTEGQCMAFTSIRTTIHLRFRRNVSGCELGLPVSMCYLAQTRRSQLKVTDLFARPLPHLTTLWSCSSVQASRSTDLTRLMCVPMPR